MEDTINFYTKRAKQMHFLMLLSTTLTAKDFVLIAYINIVAATADAFYLHKPPYVLEPYIRIRRVFAFLVLTRIETDFIFVMLF